MKKNFKETDSKYLEDAKRYNALYDEAQRATIEFNSLSEQMADAEAFYKLAEADAVKALKEYSDASAVLHAIARYIEELKKTKGNASLLNSAYQQFYDAYNKEQVSASNLEIAKSRVLKHKKQKDKIQTYMFNAEQNVKDAFDRFYNVAKMIESKYGLKTNKNRLLKLPVVGEEATLEGIEKL